jgi:hypothetical protein
MTRICPKCKAKLGGYDSFFCTACGESLPSDLIRRDGVFSRVATFSASQKDNTATEEVTSRIKQLVNLKSIVGTLIFVLLIIGGVYASKFILGKELFTTKEETPALESSSSVSYSKNVVEVPLAWDFNTFNVGGILSYVPFNASIVIEGNDLEKFSAAYVQVDPTYKDLAEFIKGKSDQQFVFFATEINNQYFWSLIYLPARADYNMDGDLVLKYAELKFWKNDPIALITSQESTLSEVSDAKGGLAKNFTQTPLYSTTKAATPKNGKVLVYLSSQKAKDYFKDLQKLPNLPKDIQMVVESISKENSDYSIIL